MGHGGVWLCGLPSDEVGPVGIVGLMQASRVPSVANNDASASIHTQNLFMVNLKVPSPDNVGPHLGTIANPAPKDLADYDPILHTLGHLFRSAGPWGAPL